jgi:hypothetical protein
VYAVDPEPAMLEALRERLERSGLHNVTPILGMGDDPLLPPASFTTSPTAERCSGGSRARCARAAASSTSTGRCARPRLDRRSSAASRPTRSFARRAAPG